MSSPQGSRSGAICLVLGALLLALGVTAEFAGWRGFGVGTGRHVIGLAGIALLGMGLWTRRGGTPLSAGACVWLGIAVGGVAGFLEVAQNYVFWFGMGEVIRQPPEFAWLVPLCYAILGGVLGVGLVVLAAIGCVTASANTAAFGLLTVFAFAQTLLYGDLDKGVGVLLAAIIALQISKGATRWAHGTRPIALAAFALIAVTAVGVSFWQAQHDDDPDQLPAPANGAPNVLFIVLDTVRWDELSCYGYSRETTPNIDAIARSGARFEQAFSTAPWTLPGHVALFAGLYHHETEADWEVPFEADAPTLSEVLQQQGYRTGGFAGNMAFCGREWGLDRGFGHYEAYRMVPGVILWTSALGDHLATATGVRRFVGSVRNNADVVTEGFLRWHETVGDRPFFAFLNLFDAHALYVTDPEFQEHFGPRIPQIRTFSNGRPYKAPAVQGLRDAYDGCLRFLDDRLGRVFDELTRRGVLEDTLVVIAGDHGEHLGEAGGRVGHAITVYPPLLHVPLILRYPSSVPAGTVVPEYVSLTDVPATVLDLIGAVRPDGMPGVSLADAWRSPETFAPRPVLAETHPGPVLLPVGKMQGEGMRTIVQDGVQLILNGDGSHELFNLDTDPLASKDRSESERAKTLVPELRQRLEQRKR